MARFRFNLRNLLPGRAAHPAVSYRTLRALNLAGPTRDAPLGPGWFESSWELVRGLDVREKLSSDTPPSDWLALCLRAAPAASAGVAQRHEQPRAGLVPAAAHRALDDAMEFGDLRFAVAAEVAHLDEFGEFGIDGLELL